MVVAHIGDRLLPEILREWQQVTTSSPLKEAYVRNFPTVPGRWRGFSAIPLLWSVPADMSA